MWPWRVKMPTQNLLRLLLLLIMNRVGNSLLQICKLRFGNKAKLLFRLSAQGLVRSLKLNLGETSDYILATFWLHSEYILATFRVHSDFTMATFWVQSGRAAQVVPACQPGWEKIEIEWENENEMERERKWRGNGQRMRELRETYSRNFLIPSLIPPSLSISRSKKSNFVAMLSTALLPQMSQKT